VVEVLVLLILDLGDRIRDRLTQVMTGELSLDDGIKRAQEDVDKAIAGS